jgi:hypothetical protein
VARRTWARRSARSPQHTLRSSIRLRECQRPLGRVQLGRVGRQGLEVQALGRALGQEVLDDLGAMDGRAIPGHQQLARDLPQQVLEEAHHVGAAQGMVAHLQQDAASGRHAADQRQVIARQRHVQHGRLPVWGIGAHHRRQHVAAGFVGPDDGASFGCRLA